ncbi:MULTISPECIES: hypothetical protein [unclassified Hyphomonas]|uniref:hypothetical protein n=1 Tax=unclassified Hyphomonas TaxID=2630699 RepID=UPI001F255E7C|nr:MULTISPECIES: hypothetical protein [unclassified Hyphomonas]
MKFLPALTDIGFRTLRRPESFSGLLGDVGPPGAFERVVEDADQGILVRWVCRARFVYPVTS